MKLLKIVKGQSCSIFFFAGGNLILFANSLKNKDVLWPLMSDLHKLTLKTRSLLDVESHVEGGEGTVLSCSY